MPSVRDSATVRPSKVVKNKTPRRRSNKSTRMKAEVNQLTVDKAVMKAARKALRPGERLVLVNETTVRTEYIK